MIPFIRPLLVSLGILAALTVHAQVDTTTSWRLVHGTLAEVTAGQVRVDVTGANGISAVETFLIGSETMVDGCELQKVQLGTQLLIYCADLTSITPTASYVKFYGCEPNWNISATIVSISPVELTLQTRDNAAGNIGDTITVKTSAETVFMSCTGMPRTGEDFSQGDVVAVYAVGQKSALRATSVLAQDDCGETIFVSGTFVSYADSTFVLAVEGKDEALRLMVSEMFGRIPADSALPIYTCSGELVPVSGLRVGDQLNVMYLSIPRQGDYLQYGQLQRDCPIKIYGTIISIDGRLVTINDGGDDYTARIDDNTRIADCRGGIIDAGNLVVGTRVDAVITEPQNENRYLSIQLRDDCPYAFYLSGRVTSVETGSITFDGFSTEDNTTQPRAISLDAASIVLNCVNEPRNTESIQPGSDAVVYYRTSGVRRIADAIMVQTPCDVAPFSGMVLAVTDESLTVGYDSLSAQKFVVDGTGVLTDCNGESLSLNPALIGSTVTGMILVTSKPPIVRSATFSVGCPKVITESGIITMVTDSALYLQGASGSLELMRTPYTAVYDATIVPVDWSTLNLGDEVCCSYNVNGNLLYRVIASGSCDDVERNGSKPIVGTVARAGSNELTIDAPAGQMSFALTAFTDMVTTSNTPVSMADVSAGMRVSVMCFGYNKSGQQVASSVTVMMSPTSVDNDVDAQTYTLLPNPASDLVTVSHARSGEIVTLYDQRGNRVLRTLTPTLSVSSLSPGVYSVVLENGIAMRLVVAR
jgi:hypothetical protein